MCGLEAHVTNGVQCRSLTELDGSSREFGERFIEGGKVATPIGKQAAKHGDDDHQPGSDAEPAIADLLGASARWPRPPVRDGHGNAVAQAMSDLADNPGDWRRCESASSRRARQCGHSPFRLARRECRTPPRELRSGWNRLA